MSWLYVFLAIGAALAIGRIWFSIKKLREQPNDDWDARLIERLRRGGADPFRPMDIDFFVALPSEAAVGAVTRELEAEGFRVDSRACDQVDAAERRRHPCGVDADARPRRGAGRPLRRLDRERGERLTAPSWTNPCRSRRPGRGASSIGRRRSAAWSRLSTASGRATASRAWASMPC
jgi:hypothetical protein